MRAPHEKRMILMRGLPSCGKSTRSHSLAGESGVVIEFDEFWHTQVGEDPGRYDWSRSLLGDARRWNFERIRRAVDSGVSPVVVDSDNSLHRATRDYVAYALERGYAIEFEEPETAWWRAIRELLRDKDENRDALERWAHKLTAMSRATHRVPLDTFQHRIARWKEDITVEDILALD